MKANGTSLSGKTFYYTGENANEIAQMCLPIVGEYTYSLEGTCDHEAKCPEEVTWCLTYNRNEGKAKNRGRYHQRCLSISRNGKYPFHNFVK